MKLTALSGLSELSGITSSDRVNLLFDDYSGSLIHGWSVAWQIVSGAQFALGARRSSDNSESLIGFSNKALDVSALETFIGSSDAFVAVVRDQIGSNHVDQLTAASQWQIASSGVLNKVDGSIAHKAVSGTEGLYSLANPLALTEFTLFAVGSLRSTTIFFSFIRSSSALDEVFINFSSSLNSSNLRIDATTGNTASISVSLADDTLYIFCYTVNSSGDVGFWVDGVFLGTITITPGTFTVDQIIRSASSDANANFAEILLANSVLTTNTINDINWRLGDRFDITTPNNLQGANLAIDFAKDFGLIDGWSLNRKLVTDYSGNAIEVRNATLSGAFNLDYISATGLIDEQALANAAFIDSATLTLIRLYDNVGSRNAAQGTGPNQYRLALSGTVETVTVGGREYLVSAGHSSLPADVSYSISTATLTAFSFFVVGARAATDSTWIIAADSGLNSSFSIGSTGLSLRVNGSTQVDSNAITISATGLNVFGVTCDNSGGVTFYHNNTAVGTATISATISFALSQVLRTGTTSTGYRFTEMLLFNQALSSAEANSVLANLTSFYGL